MFWEIVAAIASLIAIFAFVTGISNLPQLLGWFSRRSRRDAGARPSQPSGKADSAVFLPLRHWIGMLALAVTTAGVAFLILQTNSPRSSRALELAVFAGVQAVGITCIGLVIWRLNATDREMFRWMMAFPVLCAVLGLLTGIMEGGVVLTFLSTVAFMGFGGFASAVAILLAEIIGGVLFWFDLREERVRARQQPRRM